MKELTDQEFYDRLIQAGWSEKEAKAELERIHSGVYDND